MLAIAILTIIVIIAMYYLDYLLKRIKKLLSYCPQCQKYGTMEYIDSETDIDKEDIMVRKTATVSSRYSYETFDIDYEVPGKKYVKREIKTYKCDNCGHIRKDYKRKR